MSRIRTPRPAPRGPAPADWALIAISLAFCALSVLLFRSDWRLAVSTLALFGGMGAVAITILRRELREARFAESATGVSVAAGVELRAELAIVPGIRRLAVQPGSGPLPRD